MIQPAPANSVNLSDQFYSTYKAANKSFGSDTFTCAEETTAEILNHATTSDHPGMLLGKVQSGKTRTFISILALAFDNGFDIAIVLSKNSKALIEQTAKRLRANSICSSMTVSSRSMTSCTHRSRLGHLN